MRKNRGEGREKSQQKGTGHVEVYVNERGEEEEVSCSKAGAGGLDKVVNKKNKSPVKILSYKKFPL
eukprot:13359886-Ditylum_brightwellii.AAC.1